MVFTFYFDQPLKPVKLQPRTIWLNSNLIVQLDDLLKVCSIFNDNLTYVCSTFKIKIKRFLWQTVVTIHADFADSRISADLQYFVQLYNFVKQLVLESRPQTNKTAVHNLQRCSKIKTSSLDAQNYNSLGGRRWQLNTLLVSLFGVSPFYEELSRWLGNLASWCRVHLWTGYLRDL